jgi:hypothetical protein
VRALIARIRTSLYPFDQNQLWLGVGGVATMPDGAIVELRLGAMAGRAVVTFQNRVPDMIMDAPASIAPDTVRAATDPFGFLTVQALTFKRPTFQHVRAVVLVLLIAISAAMARGIEELALGFGGLILGVRGVHSMLMPQSMDTITVVDLALSRLILLLLLGLTLCAALHFLRHSHRPPPHLPVFRWGSVIRADRGQQR